MARQFISILIAGILACLIASAGGCAPNANGMMRPTLPWTRNTTVPQQPAPTPGVNTLGQNPWGASVDPYDRVFSQPTLPNSSPELTQRRWSFLNDMLKRADQQELLAEAQRKELEQLRLLQKQQSEKERAYVIKQRERERELLAKEYEEKSKLLADRERRYRGQYDQLRGRATDLDGNNRDLHAQLAKAEREKNMLRDELALLKGRLDDTTRQLSQTRNVSREAGRRLQATDQRLQALQASAAKRVGNAGIRANSSIGKSISAVDIPQSGLDIQIRQDGDTVRIGIPSDRMFMGGTASLHQGSRPYLDKVAAILEQHYPQQMVVIEAHTDHGSTPISTTQWRSHHHLTSAQAMAVLEQLTTRRVDAHRLDVMGRGGNYPLVSDGTPQGQAMNRRVEIVVYPEMYSR